MSFLNLGFGAFVVGALALIGGLFLLQRLRVRHRDVQVPTTLFWKEAVEQARARSLVERFRHVWAFLLVVAIASSLWAGFAGPVTRGDRTVSHVVLLDASAGMQLEGRFERAVERTIEAVRSLPRDTTTVRLCDGMPRTVLLPGESPHLLARRLAGCVPEDCPNTIEREIERLPSAQGQAFHVLVLGGRPLGPSLAQRLPPRSKVERISCAPSEAPTNAGITALGVAEAASGRYDMVDVFAETRGARVDALDLVIGDDAAVRLAPVRPGEFEWRDVPASGARLTARIVSPDGFAVDDAAALVLPERTPIRVEVRGSVEPSLMTALAADPAVEIVDSAADVVVRGRDGGPVDGLPAFECEPMDSAEDAIVVRGPEMRVAHDLVAMLPRLGLESVDWMELASAAARPIAMTAEQADRRSVRVWHELLTDRFDFTRSRAFPVFVGLALRWLVDEPSWHGWVAAGEPVEGIAASPGMDPVGDVFTPPSAGDYEDRATGVVFAASSFDPELAIGADWDSTGDVELGASLANWPVWLGLLALVLLVIEWVLYRTGRMP